MPEMQKSVLESSKSEATAHPKWFWSHVEKSDTCWNWIKNTASGGYGFITTPKSKKQTAAHRVAWELSNGPIPSDMDVLHSCDNPACVRPDHLFLGTAFVNTQDMCQKGRDSRKGSTYRTARGPLIMAVKEAERDFILKALEDHQGNRTRTAKFLGMSRTYFMRKLKTIKSDSMVV